MFEHKHIGKSHIEPQIHTGLINEGTIHSRVTKGTLWNQMPVDEWNIDIKEMAVIAGDKENQSILQKGTDRVSKSKESHQYAFVFSDQMAVLFSVTSLPPNHGCPVPVQSACLAVTRLGPRKVFIVARPPWALSCEHPMYHGSILSGVTAKNRRPVMER